RSGGTLSVRCGRPRGGKTIAGRRIAARGGGPGDPAALPTTAHDEPRILTAVRTGVAAHPRALGRICGGVPEDRGAAVAEPGPARHLPGSVCRAAARRVRLPDREGAVEAGGGIPALHPGDPGNRVSGLP